MTRTTCSASTATSPRPPDGRPTGQPPPRPSGQGSEVRDGPVAGRRYGQYPLRWSRRKRDGTPPIAMPDKYMPGRRHTRRAAQAAAGRGGWQGHADSGIEGAAAGHSHRWFPTGRTPDPSSAAELPVTRGNDHGKDMATSRPERRIRRVALVRLLSQSAMRDGLPRGAAMSMTSRLDAVFDRSNRSEAKEPAGSQVGSQQWQLPGDAMPRLATVGAAQRHIGPHPAASGDVGGVPPKQ
jgi:hypothetical protein